MVFYFALMCQTLSTVATKQTNRKQRKLTFQLVLQISPSLNILHTLIFVVTVIYWVPEGLPCIQCISGTVIRGNLNQR